MPHGIRQRPPGRKPSARRSPDAVAAAVILQSERPGLLTTTLDEFLSQLPASRGRQADSRSAHEPDSGSGCAPTPVTLTPARWPLRLTPPCRERNYARVVVVAPSHFDSFDFTPSTTATPTRRRWAPCRLTRLRPAAYRDGPRRCGFPAHGHDPTPAGAEHSIEVELPVAPKSAGRL